MVTVSAPSRVLAALLLSFVGVHPLIAATAESAPAPVATTPVPPPPPAALAPPTPAPPAPAPTDTPAASSVAENAVVKIFATVRYPDPYKPWTKQAPQEITGSGVVIDGKRILTNAHVALYATQIQIQANQSGDKLAASLEFIAPGIDLAVLKLEDETFFDTHPAIPRAAQLPAVKDTVMVYGFPTGGTSLSITKGIVSRIEFAPYNYPTSGLRIQIDAAINPGNSGGPAMAGDQMIGLAFSRLGGADNIGYIIPCEEIALFLDDIKDGKYDGKPTAFDDLQTLENPALRAFLKLDKSVTGLVVHEPDSDAKDYPLRQWDVITKIGDIPIDDEGMIRLGANLRVRFAYEVQHLAHDGKLPLTILRDGKTLAVQLPVSSRRDMLIESLEGEYPPYFIYGPIVFEPVSALYLSGLAGNSRVLNAFAFSASPIITRRGDRPAFKGEELVVVSSPFFPHKLIKGYSAPISRVVQTINGIAIRNLHHLVEVLRDAKGEFITIEFAGHGGESLVFPRREMLDATDSILTDNDIRSQGSPDTMALWTLPPPAVKGK